MATVTKPIILDETGQAMVTALQTIASHAAGLVGQGVPTGGTTGQVLAKKTGTDYDTEWVTPSGGTPDVYWATYGTTTSAQIEAAYQAGQLCGVEYNNRIYFLEYRTSATKHGFRVVDVVSQAGTIFSINCTSDVWSTSTLTLANSSDIPSAATATPADLGTAAVGTSTKYAKEDHVHNKPSYSAADVGAIAAPSSPTSGQYLQWNGSAWVAASLPVYNGGVS